LFGLAVMKAGRLGLLCQLGLIADVRAALESWPRFAADAGLGGKTVEAIAGEFERV
jgi:hypothetical protein